MSRDRDENGGEGFGSRWARLKREARTPPAEAPEPPAETRAEPPAGTRAEDERSDAEILKELDLPDPDTLKAGDDFKAFMTQAVPARIRNRALRRLWTSNPVLANLDRLVDYDHDYTDAALVPQFLGTGYKVGRGWLTDSPEEEGEAAEEPGGEEPAGKEADEAAPSDEAAPPEDAPPPDAAGTERAETERAETERAETERAETERAETERAETERTEEAESDSAGSEPVEGADAAFARAERAASPGAAPRRMRFRFTGD